ETKQEQEDDDQPSNFFECSVYIGTIFPGLTNPSQPAVSEEDVEEKSAHDVQVNEDKLPIMQGIVIKCSDSNCPTCLEISTLLGDYIDISESSSIITQKEKPHIAEKYLLGSKGLNEKYVIKEIVIPSTSPSSKSFDFEDKF
ncbi:hypothetical protein KI387_044393, partial [Taxus chinensis]